MYIEHGWKFRLSREGEGKVGKADNEFFACHKITSDFRIALSVREKE